MGTLNEVRQLKPRSVSGGAFLKVSPENADAFRNQFDGYLKKHFTVSWNPSNMELQVSENGKVLKHGMNQTDRIIDMRIPGVYVLVQSGNKHGFDNEFTGFMNHFSDSFEDCLFYVLYDSVINRFEIKKGVLSYTKRNDFINWNYEFDAYLEATYADQDSLIADYFTDKLVYLKAIGEEMKERDGNLDEYYEQEEYVEYLDKLERYSEGNRSEETFEIIGWLKDKIRNYNAGSGRNEFDFHL